MRTDEIERVRGTLDEFVVEVLHLTAKPDELLVLHVPKNTPQSIRPQEPTKHY